MGLTGTFLLCAICMRVVIANRIPGDLFEYQFLRADCLSSVFPDAAHFQGSLYAPSPKCLLSNGVNQFARSANNISKLLPSLVSATSFMFEIWIAFNATSAAPRTQGIISVCASNTLCYLQVYYHYFHQTMSLIVGTLLQCRLWPQRHRVIEVCL
jgi:hypothetical protein